MISARYSYTYHSREKDTKTKLKIFNLCKISSESSESSDGSKSRSDYGDSSDDIDPASKISPEISPDKNGQNHAQNQDSGDSGDSDLILQHEGSQQDQKQQQESWPVGTPEQAEAFTQEVERLQKEPEK